MKHSLLYMALALSVSSLFCCCQEDLDSRLARETRSYTEHHCPERLDESTRLDSMTYQAADRTLTRHYAITGPLDTPQGHAAVRLGQEQMRQSTRAGLENDAKWELCKRHGVRFVSIYRSAGTGSEVMRLAVDFGAASPD